MDSKRTVQDDLLVIRAQLGDQDAFESLIGRYHGRLLYYIRRLVGDHERADDVLQTVWLTAYRQFTRLRHAQAFSVWIYRIAHSKSMNAIEDRNRFIALEEETIEHLVDDTEEDSFTEIDAGQIHRALEALPPVQREALTLRFLEDMTYEGIAEVTGVPVGTVRSRLYYAKQAMKTLLEESNLEDRNHESRSE